MPVLNQLIGFLNTNDPERAKGFYGGVLGFRLISDDNFAVSFDANGTMFRINKAKNFQPAVGTVLGWEVEDIHAAIRELTPRAFTSSSSICPS